MNANGEFANFAEMGEIYKFAWGMDHHLLNTLNVYLEGRGWTHSLYARLKKQLKQGSGFMDG